METNKKDTKEVITIKAPRFRTIAVRITGTAPYVQARFAEKAMQAMIAKHKLGSAAGKNKAKAPRDFDADFEGAKHISTDGWIGVPAAAFRNACIDVCRMVGYKMTFAKMSIFIEADGFDKVDGAPLVKLIAEEPERLTMACRNQTGVVDMRVRPMWREWSAIVRARFDEDQFSASDVVNLLSRAGIQIGVGEGRPFSRESNGLGYGTFTIAESEAKAA